MHGIPLFSSDGHQMFCLLIKVNRWHPMWNHPCLYSACMHYIHMHASVSPSLDAHMHASLL